MISGIHTPSMPPPMMEGMIISPPFVDMTSVPPPFTTEELGLAWPNERGIFNPSAIPLWLQEKNLTDLGLPVNGSDGIFLQVNGTNGWSGEFAPMPEAW